MKYIVALIKSPVILLSLIFAGLFYCFEQLIFTKYCLRCKTIATKVPKYEHALSNGVDHYDCSNCGENISYLEYFFDLFDGTK